MFALTGDTFAVVVWDWQEADALSAWSLCFFERFMQLVKCLGQSESGSDCHSESESLMLHVVRNLYPNYLDWNLGRNQTTLILHKILLWALQNIISTYYIQL